MATEDKKTKNLKEFEALVKAASAGTPISPLQHQFDLSGIKPENGQWYFAIECPNCKHATPIFRDYSEGELGNPFTGPGGVTVSCHYCPAELRAAAPAIHSLLWREGGSIKV